MKPASREWLIRTKLLMSGLVAGWALFSPQGGNSLQVHNGGGHLPGQANSNFPQASAKVSTGARLPDATSGPTTTASGGNVRERFESGMRLANPRRRLRAFLRQLETLTAVEAPELRQLIYDLNREGLQLPDEWEAFIQRWGELDGQAAAEHALSKAGEVWVPGGLRIILTGWAARDPAGAADWLNNHADSPFFDTALQGIISGVAETDPAAATRTALASLPEGNRDLAGQLMEQLADAVVRTGKNPALLEWFDNLPDQVNGTAVKNAAFGHVWWRLQTADIHSAASWLADKANEPWRNDRQYGETTHMLARNDPAAALDWAGSLPPSSVDGRWPGVNTTLRDWLAKDPAAASAYINSRPATAFGDYVRTSHANLLNPPPPEPR